MLSWWKINVCSHIHFSAFSFLLWSACTHRVCCQLVRYLHVSCRIRENSFPPQGFSHFCRFFHRVTIRIECESLHRIETDLFYAVKFAFVGVTHKHRFHGVLRKKEIFGRSTSSLTTYPGFLFFSFFGSFHRKFWNYSHLYKMFFFQVIHEHTRTWWTAVFLVARHFLSLALWKEIFFLMAFFSFVKRKLEYFSPLLVPILFIFFPIWENHCFI